MNSKSKGAIVGAIIVVVIIILLYTASIGGTTKEIQNINSNHSQSQSTIHYTNSTGKHIVLELHESVGIKSR